MTTDRDPEIIDQAIDWHVRQAGLDERGWQAFVAWLERSPTHASAYDRIAAEDRLLVRPEPAGRAVNDDQPLRRRWRLPAIGVVAAAVVFALVWPMTRPPIAQSYLVRTDPGERKTVQLAGGTKVELSGATRLRFDRADPRFADLEAGEAVFTVKHDQANPFTLRSGGISIRDLGTVFNVMREGPRLDVQVSEGSALVEPGRAGIRLEAGDALVLREDTGRVTRTRLPLETIGAWRTGKLRFQNETMPAVLASVRRSYGTRIDLEGDLPRLHFTGNVQFTGDAGKDVPHLAAMVGVGWRRNGEQWIFAPPTAAAR